MNTKHLLTVSASLTLVLSGGILSGTLGGLKAAHVTMDPGRYWVFAGIAFVMMSAGLAVGVWHLDRLGPSSQGGFQ